MLKQNEIILTVDDSYFKKFVFLRFQNKEIKLKTSQALFSSQDVDLGTRHLLRTLDKEDLGKYKKILDLGAGYGPIGLALKNSSSSSEVHMVDKDALALEYSRENASINNVSDIKIYGSLGYYDVSDKDFDLIVSNVPAKVGDKVLEHILIDAREYLKPGGRVAIVVIDAIGDYVTRLLSNNGIKIIFQKRWPGHLVFHYEFVSYDKSLDQKLDISLEAGIYARGEKVIPAGGSKAILKTTYNLPEFDTLSFETELLINSLGKFKNQFFQNIIVFNPSQGFIPVYISKIAKIGKLNLFDRDLQALRITEENLNLNNFPYEKITSFFQVGMTLATPITAELIVGILSDKDSQNVNAMIFQQATSQLNVGGFMALSSSSTAITRIEGLVKRNKVLNIVSRQKRRGKSSILLARKQ